MKIWKWILGIFAALGGAAAVAAASSKKEYDKKVEENKAQIKEVQEAAAAAEAERIRLKKEKSKAKKKTAATKAQVKDTSNAKQTTQNFEKKYRRRRPKKNA